MKFPRFLVAALLGCSLLALASTGDARMTLSGVKNHRETNLIIESTSDGALPTEAKDNLRITFSAFRRIFELQLVPSTVVDEGTKTFIVDDEGEHEVPTRNISYMGTVVGEESSSVRVTLMRGAVVGYIKIGSEIYGIEPRATYDPFAPEGSIIVYRGSDNPPEQFPCGRDYQEEATPKVMANALRVMRQEIQVGLPEGASPKMVLSNDQLRRHDLGVMGDYQFYSLTHAGNADAANADMDAAVNAADGLFRDSIPSSGALTLRVSVKKLYTSVASQLADGIAGCPRACFNGTSTTSPGNFCTTTTDCSVGTCQTIPTHLKTCHKDGAYTYEGKVCRGDTDCPSSGTCTNAEIETDLCDLGPDDGEICQKSSAGCATFGNCCSSTGGGTCENWLARPRRAAGRYRIANNTISTTNSDAIHLFTGCSLGGGSGTGPLCETTGSGSSSVTQHPGTDKSALIRFGVLGHEVGHTIQGYHDDSAHCEALGLAIESKVCASGPKLDLMCNTNTDCRSCSGGSEPQSLCSINSDCAGGGSCVSANCTKNNKRTCTTGGATCVSNSDCAGGANGPCTGPGNRLCVGGSLDGEICNTLYSSTCPSPGTCTGAPMNWDLYFMGGSGTLFGYSPCSQVDLVSYNSSGPSCLATIDCADVTVNGVISASDSQKALLIANASGYDDLADVAGTGGLGADGSVTSADADYILNVAVGFYPAPTTCGRDDEPWW